MKRIVIKWMLLFPFENKEIVSTLFSVKGFVKLVFL